MHGEKFFQYMVQPIFTSLPPPPPTTTTTTTTTKIICFKRLKRRGWYKLFDSTKTISHNDPIRSQENDQRPIRDYQSRYPGVTVTGLEDRTENSFLKVVGVSVCSRGRDRHILAAAKQSHKWIHHLLWRLLHFSPITCARYKLAQTSKSSVMGLLQAHRSIFWFAFHFFCTSTKRIRTNNPEVFYYNKTPWTIMAHAHSRWRRRAQEILNFRSR